ncbi:hypothetical protein N7499_002183 [Penicillium canescens]|nr:hypothetical protein N7499_002183 [Penicillium canescens]
MASFQDRAQHTIAQLDKELSKYPVLNNLERQTNVPKVYAILGLVGVYFFLVFFNIAGEFLVNFAGFIIPGYYSLQALFTSNTQDDTQWLTYWVVFAFLTVIESAISAAYWFPFYYIFKFVLILWMALPRPTVPKSSSSPSSSPLSAASSPAPAPPPTSALRPRPPASPTPPKGLLSELLSRESHRQ